MNQEAQHNKERTEDQRDRKRVFDLRAIDSLLLKIAGGIMGVFITIILGFAGWLGMTTVQHGEQISSIVQWQSDKGNEIDEDHSDISQIYDAVKNHWMTSMADSTNLKI